MRDGVMLAAGFLLAVLWFDLMFDVQVLRHRREAVLPEPVLDSIARYYRRVTTDASPMNRAVAGMMLLLLATLAGQAVLGRAPGFVSVVSLGTASGAIGLAASRTFPNARRLGRREDPPPQQTRLARDICRDHLVCLGAMATVVAAQLAGAS